MSEKTLTLLAGKAGHSVYLVDTHVVSEARKGKKANLGVQKFWQTVDESELYLSIQTVGEIRRGIENIKCRGDLPQAGKLERWLDQIVDEYSDRMLNFVGKCSQVWGRLMSPDNQHQIDKQIAAIALIHGLTVVARNVEDFRGTGVELQNPFA